MFNGDNFIGSDYFKQYYALFKPGTTVTSFYITAKKDHILEFDESFTIVAYPPSSPSGYNNCYTKVYIEDRDGKLEIKLFYINCLKSYIVYLYCNSSYIVTYVYNSVV